METEVQIARQISSVNPATGEVLRTLDCAGDAEVRSAVEQARAAQPHWHAIGISKRLRILREFQRLLHANKSHVARVITSEAGKPYVEALTTEVVVVLDAARFLIEHAYALLRDRAVPHGSLAM